MSQPREKSAAQREQDAIRVAGYAMVLVAHGYLPTLPGMRVEIAPLLFVPHPE